MNIRHAIANSSEIGLPIAVTGATDYIINGWNGWGQAGLPEHTFGYVYWPTVILIASVSFFTTKLGAYWARTLPVATLKKVFVILLILLSLKMLQSVVLVNLSSG